MNNRFGSQLLFAAGGIGGMIVMALLTVRWGQVIAYRIYIIILGLLVILLLCSGVDLFLLAAVVIPALVAVLALFGQTPTVVSVLAGGAILFFIFRRNLALTIAAFGIVIAVAFSTNFIYEHLHQYQ